MSTDIASIQVLLYFIFVDTKLHCGWIKALVEILMDILDVPHIKGEFAIDMTEEYEQEKCSTGDKPSIVQHVTPDIVLSSSLQQ
jgi:hypothetical protein